MSDSLTTELTETALAQLAADVEDLNGAYPDAILFLARHLGGRLDTAEAEIAAVEDQGVTLHVRNSDGAGGQLRIDFEQPPSTLEQARASLYGLFARARSVAGESAPSTSLEREIAAATGLSTFQTSVAQVEDLTPRLRQITFAGGLESFVPIAPDQYLLVTPETGGGLPPPSAYYTVRRWRPDRIDMWFVLHGHGPLSNWAASAAPGATVSLWGPRTSFRPPPDTRQMLLLADDTGLPAIAAILEANREVPALVVLETYDANRDVKIEAGPRARIEWLPRSDDPPGSKNRLLEAVKRHDLEINGLYAFGAAESRQTSAVRRHLRTELRMPQTHVQMTGYWRSRQTDPSSK